MTLAGQSDYNGFMPAKKRPSVGIRELKANLSSYVRRAQAGETIDVTDRGAVVAELRPRTLSAEEIDRRLAAMVKEGRVTPAKSTDRGFLRKWKGLGWKRGEAQKLLDEERKDRF